LQCSPSEVGPSWPPVTAFCKVRLPLNLGATTVTKGIKHLISKSDLSHKDKLNLTALERRLACIMQPLNFCLLRLEQQSNSIMMKPVHQSVALIEDLIQFIQRVNSNPKFVFDGKALSNRTADDFSEELQHYKDELDFLQQSLLLVLKLNEGQGTPSTVQ